MIFRRFSAFLPVSAALLVAAVVLSACGRKGGLDAPPSASVAGQAAVDESGGTAYSGREGGATGLPMIKGPNKRIPLDALLD